MVVYYAHHQYIYFSRREQLELNLIKSYFTNPEIINPALFDFNNSSAKLTEVEIMDYCFNQVLSSDILVFGSIDGFVGKGVHDEVLTALTNNIPVYEITKTEIIPFTGIFDLLNRDSNRIYAQVIRQ